jgi:hypothetical protein
MSLAQHVSFAEGELDRQQLEPSPDSPYLLPHSGPELGRVLSYDPFPPAEPEDQANFTAAYKVSTVRRAGKRT